MRFKGMDRNFYANGPLSTDDSRLRNVEVRYKVPSTKYNEGIESTRYLPAAGRRNTELKPMSNAERPVQNVEGKYNVPSTIDTRCKKPACGRQARD